MTRDSWIYAINAPEVSRGRVKIGYTNQDPDRRLKQLQTGSPVLLSVAGVWPGGEPLEKALHDYFADKRLHLEWFEFGDQDPAVAIGAVIAAGVVVPRTTPEPAWKSAPNPEAALRHEVYRLLVTCGLGGYTTWSKRADRLEADRHTVWRMALDAYQDKARLRADRVARHRATQVETDVAREQQERERERMDRVAQVFERRAAALVPNRAKEAVTEAQETELRSKLAQAGRRSEDAMPSFLEPSL